jgi:DNA-binding MarR family transcriptional regulator
MAARLIQRRQDQALADLGLTHAAVIALQGLTAGPLNQEQLAEEIHVRSQSLGRVLARLEDAGFVTRKSSSLDRRSNDVAITEAGLRALAAARQVEKETLPPDMVEGAVLSRELARVISHFPGSSRLGARQRKNPSAGSDEPDAEAVADAEAPTVEALGPESSPQDARMPDAKAPDSKAPDSRMPDATVANDEGEAIEPRLEQADTAPAGDTPQENSGSLNGNREN